MMQFLEEPAHLGLTRGRKNFSGQIGRVEGEENATVKLPAKVIIQVGPVKDF